MRSVIIAAAAAFAVAVFPAPSRADDYTGRWALGLDAGWGGRLGSKVVSDTAANGPALGASLTAGLTPHWRAAVNYENINLNPIRYSPLTASAIYAFTPAKRWTPLVEVGLGGARAMRIPDRGTESIMAAKGAVGLEYSLCSAASASAQAAVYHSGHSTGAQAHEVDAAVLSLGLKWWFGGSKPAVVKAEPVAPLKMKPAPVVAAPPPPPPAPAPVPVTVAVTPASADVAHGASASFAAAVTGSENKGVTWSIDPSVGSITPAGVYTAPASVAADTTVAVTATSVADSTKKSTAQVRLFAPKKVSISLDVQFEANKVDVRPEFEGKIGDVAAFLKAHPAATAAIEGYTDTSGNKDKNTALSQGRADSVRAYLIEHFGIDGSRLTAKGFGPEKPIAPNDTPENRAKNRRVVANIDAQE